MLGLAALLVQSRRVKDDDSSMAMDYKLAQRCLLSESLVDKVFFFSKRKLQQLLLCQNLLDEFAMPQRVEPLDEATLKAKIEHDPAVEERLELKLWPWKRIKDDKLPVKAPILEYGNLYSLWAL